MESHIPLQVSEKARAFFGGKEYYIEYLGIYKGKEAYFTSIKGISISGGSGLPSIILFDGKDSYWAGFEGPQILSYFSNISE